MMTIKDLQARLGMTEWPVRRLLDAVAPLLQAQLHRKPGQPLQVDPAAIGLLERAKILMDRGTPRAQLVEVLQAELQPQQQTSANGSGDAGKSEQTPLHPASTSGELVAELRRQIERLEDDKAWLQRLLEEQAAQLQAALPAVSEGRQRMGRLAHLRAFFTGNWGVD